MAVSNPPTFGAATNPAAGSVRKEFESLGSNTSLYAYRRGGGIVPDSSYYSGIGLGTSESPLKLTQFAGLSAISNWLARITYNSGAYGSLQTGGGYGDNIKFDADGNIYVAGVVGTNYDISNSVLVAKINPTGNLVWFKNYNGTSYTPTGVTVALHLDSSNNIGLTFSARTPSNSDVGFFASKLNNAGAVLWTKFVTLGTGSDFMQNSCMDSAGSMYLVGYTTEGAPTGYLGAIDTYAIKIDTNGNIIWQTTHRTADENFFTSCWTDGSYLYCTGEYNWYSGIQLMKIDATYGGLIANWYYVNGRSGYGGGITGDNLGYLYLVGNCSDPGYYFPVVFKVDAATGTVQWQKWFEAYGGGPNVVPIKYDSTSNLLFTSIDGSGTFLCMNPANGDVQYRKYIYGSQKYSFDTNSTTLAVAGGDYSPQQYNTPTTIWNTGRLPKDGTKTGNYILPDNSLIYYSDSALADHTILNGNVTRKNGGGTYLSRYGTGYTTDITATDASTSMYQKVTI